jgi:hypothetical protein
MHVHEAEKCRQGAAGGAHVEGFCARVRCAALTVGRPVIVGGHGSGVSAPESFDGGTLDLVTGHVADMLREAPPVTEGVCDLGVALAGEPVGCRPDHLRPGGDGLLDESVDVISRQVEDG